MLVWDKPAVRDIIQLFDARITNIISGGGVVDGRNNGGTPGKPNNEAQGAQECNNQ